MYRQQTCIVNHTGELYSSQVYNRVYKSMVYPIQKETVIQSYIRLHTWFHTSAQLNAKHTLVWISHKNMMLCPIQKYTWQYKSGDVYYSTNCRIYTQIL